MPIGLVDLGNDLSRGGETFAVFVYALGPGDGSLEIDSAPGVGGVSQKLLSNRAGRIVCYQALHRCRIDRDQPGQELCIGPHAVRIVR
jgi:hypothetical protein